MNGLIYFLGATMLGVLTLAAFAIVLFVLYIVTGYAVGVIRLMRSDVVQRKPMHWYHWVHLFLLSIWTWMESLDLQYRTTDDKLIPAFGWSKVKPAGEFYGA